MQYRLKDNQIAGRYYGVDVAFDSLEEIRETLVEALSNENPEEDYSEVNLDEILEMMDYELETLN